MNLITVNYDKFESVSRVVERKPDVLQDFSDLFTDSIGTLPGSVQLTLKPDTEPVLRPPKRLPIELHNQTKQQLDRLVHERVLAPVDEPTSG